MIRMKKMGKMIRMIRLMLVNGGGKQEEEEEEEQPAAAAARTHPLKTQPVLVNANSSSHPRRHPESRWLPLSLARSNSLLHPLRWDRGNLVGRV